MNAPAPRWNEGVRELRFTFGEFRIATARLPAWILAGHFLDTPDALNELPAFADVPAHVQVLAIQSLAVARDLPRVTLLPDAIRYVPTHFPHHCIELAGSFEDYLQRLSGKSRHEMARKARRFCAHSGGRHEVREFRDPADMAEFVRIAGALSRATYQGRLLHVGLPDDAGFVRELEEAAARADVRGYVVTIGDRPQAFGYCRASGDVLVFEHTGYDPEAAPHSPGIYLLQEMLRRIHAERRFRIFDFGTGDAQYKRSYATTTRRCATVLQVRRTARNRALVATHRALSSLSDGCVRLLEIAGVKARVRRLFRSMGGRRSPEASPSDRPANQEADAAPRFET